MAERNRRRPKAVPPSVRRLPIVGVLGSGSVPHRARSESLGRWLASLPVHLLTGGGGGVMSEVSRAFAETAGREGMVLGILPADPERPGAPAAYPNPWVEITVRTHLPARGAAGADPLSRNHLNILSSQVLVALPGGAGTSSEVHLALRYGTPVVAFVGASSDIPDLPSIIPVAPTLVEVQRFVTRHL